MAEQGEVFTMELGTETIGSRVYAFIVSLVSRKFLLTLGAFITFIGQEEYDKALYAVLGYLGIEGGADIVERHQRAKPSPVVVEDAETVNVETPAPKKATTRRRSG